MSEIIETQLSQCNTVFYQPGEVTFERGDVTFETGEVNRGEVTFQGGGKFGLRRGR